MAGPPAGGEEHQVGVQRLILTVGQHTTLAVGFQLQRPATGMQHDAGVAERLGQPLAQVLVEAAQRQGLAVDQVHLGAERLENAGEFDRDVAGAEDRHAVRHPRQEERVVGDDAELGARDGHTLRMAAGGDDDALGGETLAADIQRVRIDEHRAGIEDRGAGTLQQLAVEGLEAADLLVLGGDQLVPVMRPLFDGPAEAGGVVRPATILAGLHQQLLRHAADIDAGAAPEAFLGDADAGAVAGGDAGAAHAGGAATDDEQIEVHGVCASVGGQA